LFFDRLTKEAVRNHRNTRVPVGGDTAAKFTQDQGHTGIQQYLQNVPGVAQVHSLSGRVNEIGALVGASGVQGHQDASTSSASRGHHYHHQVNQHREGHHRVQGSHGGRQQDSFVSVHGPSSHGIGDNDPSMPSFPTIPGLGFSTESFQPHSGEAPPVPYPVYQRHQESSFSSYGPPSFPNMPHESSSHSGYAPSYAPPPVQGPFGFPDPGDAYRGVEEDRYHSGSRGSEPPSFEGEAQYGFPAFPEAPQPHGGHHSHGGRRHGEHRHGGW